MAAELALVGLAVICYSC